MNGNQAQAAGTENVRTYHSLSAVTRRLQEILAPAMQSNFWVKAEISSSRKRGGAFFCNLVETNSAGTVVAQLSCQVWAEDLSRMSERFRAADMELDLSDGTMVALLCRVNFHPRHGLSLVASDADPLFALGLLELQKRRLIEALEKEGLLDANRRIPVPRLPLRIGFVTGRGSAACQDVLITLEKARVGFEVLLADAYMQGKDTEESVLNALEALARLRPELVLIARGGGSRTDLAWLDNERIARAVAGYPFPVWCGIGHETDTGVLDHVAHSAFKTPTAMAEELIRRFEQERVYIANARNLLKTVWGHRLVMEGRWLKEQIAGVRQGTRKLVDQTRTSLVACAGRFSNLVSARLNRQRLVLVARRTSLSARPVTLLGQCGQHLDTNRERLQAAGMRAVESRGRELRHAQNRFGLDRVVRVLHNELLALKGLAERLARTAAREIDRKKSARRSLTERLSPQAALRTVIEEQRNLSAKLALVNAADPRRNLARGYAIVTLPDGRAVKSARLLAAGSLVKTELAEGTFTSVVRTTTPERQEDREHVATGAG